MNDKLSDMLSSLLDFSWDHDIGILLSRSMDPDTPSSANPDNRIILINMNTKDQKSIPFQVAHEMSHVLNADPGVLYFQADEQNKSLNYRYTFEHAADIRALKIIIPAYIHCNDGIAPNNSIRFMEELAIPTSLVSEVNEELQKYQCD